MKVLSFFLTSFLLTQAMALDLKNTIIKIDSYPCLDKTKIKSGSAVGFNYQGGAYLVTSEHVTYHDPVFCFSGQSNDYNNLKLKLIKADWASGLSLLEVVKGGTNFKELDELMNGPIGDKGFSAGYPLQTKKLTITRQAKILNSNTNAQRFLSDSKILRLDTQEAVIGMSGGGVFQKQGGEDKLIGLNTHIDTNGKKESLLAISGVDVKKWIKENLGLENSQSSIMVTDVDHQKRIINFSGIEFLEKNNEASTLSSDLMSISTDPIGIGGAPSNARPGPITITLFLKDYHNTPLDQIPLAYHETITRLKARLMKKNEVSISYFYGDSKLYPLYSSQQFAKHMMLGHRPIIQANNIFIEKEAKELFSLIHDLEKMTQELKKLTPKSQLLHDLNKIVTIGSSQTWYILTDEDINLSIGRKKLWRELYKDEKTLDLAIDIRANIMTYQKLRRHFIIE